MSVLISSTHKFDDEFHRRQKRSVPLCAQLNRGRVRPGWRPPERRALVTAVKGRGVPVYYRLYLMRGDRIRDAIEIHAPDDESALQKARARKGSLPAELWCRSRRVATLLAA